MRDRADEHAREAAAAAGTEHDEAGVGGQAQEVLGGMAPDLDQFGVVAAPAMDGVL